MVERQVNIKARVEGIEEAAGNMATLQASARTTRKEIKELKKDVQDLSKALQELQANAKAVNTGIIAAASKVMGKQRKKEGTESERSFNLDNIGKDDVEEEKLRTKILKEYQTQLDKNIKLQEKIQKQRVEYNALTGSVEITVPERNKTRRKQEQYENEIDYEPVEQTPPTRRRTRRKQPAPAPAPTPFVPLQPPPPEPSYLERIDPNASLEEKQAAAQRNIEAAKKRFQIRAPDISPIKYKIRAENMALGYAKTYEDSAANEDKNTGVLHRAGMDQTIQAIRAIREKDNQVIVSKIGREVVGGLAFALKKYQTHTQADITNVGAKYYGVGAGDVMMDMFDKQMIKHGVDTATIPHAYPEAHKLYMRHGFVPENMQDVGIRTTRMTKYMNNNRFLEMDAPNIGPMGADTSELFKLLQHTYRTGNEEAFWKDLNKGTDITPWYMSTVNHLSFFNPASKYKDLLTARYHTHLPHALAIPSGNDVRAAAELPGIEGIVSGAGNVLEMQVPENIKINKFVKEWEHIMLAIRKRGPQGKTNVQFQKTFQDAFLELAKKYKVKTSVYDILPADARQQILRGFDNLVVDAPDISPLSFESLLEKEFEANPKLTNKMAISKIGDVFGTSISQHKIKAKMAELRKASKQALADIVVPMNIYGFTQAQEQAEQSYDPSYQPLVGQFIPPTAPFSPPAAHVQLTTPAILKESDEQILKFQHVFEELLGPRLHSKLKTQFDEDQGRTYGAFTVVIDADLSDPSEMLGHIKSSWDQALLQTDALLHPFAPDDDDWVRRTRTYEKSPQSEEERRQAQKITQLDAEIAMRKEERMKEREEEKQAASTWKQKLNEWKLERKKRDVIFKHFGGISHVDFTPQTGWKRDEAGNIVSTGGAVTYPEEGKSDRAVVDANELLRRVRSKRVIDPSKIKDDIKEPATAIGKIIDQLVNKGGALGRLSWTFTSLAMSGLGVYFSLMSIVGMLQQGIMAVFNPLQNLQGIIQGYAMSVSQFGKDSPINLDNFFEQLFGDPDGIERITRAWKFLQGIMDTITTSLGAFGAKVLLDPEVQEAIVGIVKELQNFLLKPETFLLVKNILLKVREIMPDILNAFAYLGRLVETVLLPNAKLFAQAWATSIVIMPIASLASAILNVGKAIAFGAEQAFMLKKGLEGAKAASTMGMFGVGAMATSPDAAAAMLPSAGTAGMAASLTTVAAALGVLVVGLGVAYTAWIQNWNHIQERTANAAKDIQEAFNGISEATGNADTGGLVGAVGALAEAFGGLHTMWMELSGSNALGGMLWEEFIIKVKEATLAIYVITDAMNIVAKSIQSIAQAVSTVTGIKVSITSEEVSKPRDRRSHERALDASLKEYATKRADGGPLRAGQLAVVGERGPELLVPKGDVEVIPNHKLRFLADGTSVGQSITSGSSATEYLRRALNDNTDALYDLSKTIGNANEINFGKSLVGGPGSVAEIMDAGKWTMSQNGKTWDMNTISGMREQYVSMFGKHTTTDTSSKPITPFAWNKPTDLGEYDILNIDTFTSKMKDLTEESKKQTQVLQSINTNVQNTDKTLTGALGEGGAGTAGSGGVWRGAGQAGGPGKPTGGKPTGTAADFLPPGPTGGILTASPYHPGGVIEEANPYHKPTWSKGPKDNQWADPSILTGDVAKDFGAGGPGWNLPYGAGDSYGWDNSSGAPSVSGYAGGDPYKTSDTGNGKWVERESGHYFTDLSGKTWGPFKNQADGEKYIKSHGGNTSTSATKSQRDKSGTGWGFTTPFTKTETYSEGSSSNTSSNVKIKTVSDLGKGWLTVGGESTLIDKRNFNFAELEAAMQISDASKQHAAKWQTATAADFGYQNLGADASSGMVGEVVQQGKDTFVRQADGSLKLISSMASGGLLTKGGLINAHAGEVIGPLGQVASTLAQAATVNSTNNSATNQNITVNITITGDATKDVTDDMIRKIKRDLFGRGVV